MKIKHLSNDEVFVFGSNSQGHHSAGAARTAWRKFGAIWGEGHGHHGQSYAVDTMSGPEILRTEIAAFCQYAQHHPDLTFLVTELGCGIAGYTPAEVAPLFTTAPANVQLPPVFSETLQQTSNE